MMIKGGIFDKVRDEDLIAELCGATKSEEYGATSVTFKIIDSYAPQTGLIRYSRYKLIEQQRRYASCGVVQHS